jgi:hypothetical protein
MGRLGARRRSVNPRKPAQPVTSPVLSPAPPPDAALASSELGISLGSFQLFPTLDVRAGYDSNGFAAQTQQTGSAYEAIRPSLEVRSNWNNHMLNFGANGIGRDAAVAFAKKGAKVVVAGRREKAG